MRIFAGGFLLGLALPLGAIWAQQSADARPQFEVASIKPSPPPDYVRGVDMGCDGGPGTRDPGLLTCENLTLSDLVEDAYNIKHFQLSGPAWMNETRFNITAKIPPGTNKQQLRPRGLINRRNNREGFVAATRLMALNAVQYQGGIRAGTEEKEGTFVALKSTSGPRHGP